MKIRKERLILFGTMNGTIIIQFIEKVMNLVVLIIIIVYKTKNL